MTRARRTVRDITTVGVLAVLMGSVYLLPPDTSLGEIQRAGLLRACIPPEYPPLVTADPQHPGIEVELLQALAGELGVRLELSRVSAMGRDFNPRSWGLNRAQCQVIAGGVVDSPLTRSFLDVVIPHAETGWAVVTPEPQAAPAVGRLDGGRIGVLVGVSGLDRIALSRYLRDRGVQPVIVASAEDLVAGLSEGRFEAAVTEALLAEQIAAAQGWSAAWLKGELERRSLVIGLWKGDLTLKRALAGAFARLEAHGEVGQILERYLGTGASAVDPSD